jgi:cytochrome c-type biogenesis protein CcmE
MKKTHIIGLLVIAIAIGVIVALVGDFSTYESFAAAKNSPEVEMHVVGVLDRSHPVEYDAVKNANYFGFYMIDKNQDTCHVAFNGTKPQDFERSEQIVITGKMSGADFKANHMLLKCPSKYTNKEEELSEFSAK